MWGSMKTNWFCWDKNVHDPETSSFQNSVYMRIHSTKFDGHIWRVLFCSLTHVFQFLDRLIWKFVLMLKFSWIFSTGSCVILASVYKCFTNNTLDWVARKSTGQNNTETTLLLIYSPIKLECFTFLPLCRPHKPKDRNRYFWPE